MERPEGTGTVSLRSEDESGEVVVRTPPVAGASAGLCWVVDGCEVTVDVSIERAVDPGGVWTGRGVFTSAGGEHVFVDNPANAPVRRFYRLVIPRGRV